jgi:heme/copper-type cytochrome/quinol oxidase subunit 2
VLLLAASSILVGVFELVAFASGDSDPQANEHVSGASWIALGLSIVAGLAAYLLMRGAGRSRARAATWGALMTIAGWLVPIAIAIVLVLISGQI